MNDRTWTVTEADAGLRLDKFLADTSRLTSRGRATEAIAKGKVFVNGAEVDAAKDPITVSGWFREAVNYLTEYVIDQDYDMKFSLEPKPNEPRGDLYLPTVGSMLAFISTLDHPEMVGLNPETAHIKMAGLNPYHEFAQALDAGKLLDVDEQPRASLPPSAGRVLSTKHVLPMPGDVNQE